MTHGPSETVATGCSFPESPRWHDGAIWFSDLMERAVFRIAGSTPEVVIRLDDMPSGLGFLPDGTPLVVGMRSKRLYAATPGSEEPALYADLSEHGADLGPGNLNDMVVDPKGNAYIDVRVKRRFHSLNALLTASAASDGAAPPSEAIVLVRSEGDPGEIVARDLVGPNGLAITADGSRLVVAESLANRVSSFAIDDDGGGLHDRRVEIDLVDQPPDGLCLDAEGGIWVGVPLRNHFVRVLDGVVVDTIETGTSLGIACVLGGEDRRTLIMALSDTTLREMRLMWDDETAGDARQWASGRIETCRVDVPGAGSP